MPTLTLTERQQAALRSLMTFDAVRERTLPPPETLRLIGALVPCDAMGVAVVDDDGTCAEEVVLPPSWTAMLLDGEVSGPVPLGIVHWGRHRDEADACGALEGVADCLAVGFPWGSTRSASSGSTGRTRSSRTTTSRGSSSSPRSSSA